jgi:hypothetical protein
MLEIKFYEQLLSAQQAAKRGMQCLQGSLGRLKMPMPAEDAPFPQLLIMFVRNEVWRGREKEREAEARAEAVSYSRSALTRERPTSVAHESRILAEGLDLVRIVRSRNVSPVSWQSRRFSFGLVIVASARLSR